MKTESIEEFLKRGGEVKKLAKDESNDMQTLCWKDQRNVGAPKKSSVKTKDSKKKI